MQKFIDLHTHSTASDGTDCPEMLIAKAKSAGLSAIALTDHNNFDGLQRAQNIADELNIELIHGIEISAKHNNSEIHILGLWIDSKPNVENFEPMVKKYKNNLYQKNFKILEKCKQLNISLHYSDLYKIIQEADTAFDPSNAKQIEYYEGSTIRKPFILHSLVNKNYIKDIAHAKDFYQEIQDELNLQDDYLEPKEVIELLRENKAFVALAHPFRYNEKDLKNLLKKLKDFGLQGLECYHSSNSSVEEENSLTLAKELNLIPTGGSDYHALIKPNVALGEYAKGKKIPYAILDNIREYM